MNGPRSCTRAPALFLALGLGAGVLLAACSGSEDDAAGGACAEFVDPTLESSAPSVVRVRFRLRECRGGAPISSLNLSDFELREDGHVVSSLESGAAMVSDERAFQQSVVLMLDVSGSVLDSLPELKRAAGSMVEMLARSPQVAVYTFDGREQPRLRASFTSDVAVLLEAIDAIEPERVDTSTNLNGAVSDGIRILADRRVRIEAEGALFAGALAVFTDGTDRAARVTEEVALGAVTSSSESVFAIGLGAEIDEPYLRAIGQTGGVVLARDLDELSAAFATTGQAIAKLANSYYVLSYCSPSRAERHELSLALEGRTGSFEARFDATGFEGGCSPTDFLPPAP